MNIWALAWVAFAVVWAIGFGSRTAWLAGERRRDRGRWFLFGAVLGPAGLLILDDAPPGTCASCLTPVAGWSMTCVACGEDVRTNARVSALLKRKAEPEPADVAEPGMVTGLAVGPGRSVTAPGTGPATDSAIERSNGAAARVPGRRRGAPSRAASTAAEASVAPPATPPREAPARSLPPTTPATLAPAAMARDAAPMPVRQPRAPEAPPVAAPPSTTPAEAQPQLDQLRRPVRLASCIFVEGNVNLFPGLWYQLSTEDGVLTITGQAGSIPNATAWSRALSDIEVRTRGDQLVVSAAPSSEEDIRLVFKSTLDWTPMGVAMEVDARRRGIEAG